MNEDCLKLTSYFGERDRAGRRFLADALLDAFGRRSFAASVLLRGIEGFGVRHRLHTERLLTMSEDLPLVAVAIDTRARIEAALDEVVALQGDGLVTLERARLASGSAGWPAPPHELPEQTKLTVYCGRLERAAGRPAHLAIVDLLQRSGVAGATVLLGVDGTVAGERRRARFFSRNATVPLMIVSVGTGERIGHILPRLDALLAHPLVILERVRVLKRDGRTLAPPPPAEHGMWQKLMVYASESARHDGHPLHLALLRGLRREGAAGATTLRGFWGYHGDHRPHGDQLLALRRHSPLVTIVVDSPQRCQRWFELIDAATRETGLVTSEFVPALRASAPGHVSGSLRLG